MTQGRRPLGGSTREKSRLRRDVHLEVEQTDMPLKCTALEMALRGREMKEIFEESRQRYVDVVWAW